MTPVNYHFYLVLGGLIVLTIFMRALLRKTALPALGDAVLSSQTLASIVLVSAGTCILSPIIVNVITRKIEGLSCLIFSQSV